MGDWIDEHFGIVMFVTLVAIVGPIIYFGAKEDAQNRRERAAQCAQWLQQARDGHDSLQVEMRCADDGEERSSSSTAIVPIFIPMSTGRY